MRFSDLSKLSGVLGIITICLTGCSDSSDNAESAETTGILQVPEVTIATELDENEATLSQLGEPILDDATPQLIVQDFLSALQLGDDNKISNLLTTKAKEETEKHDLVVRSPGSPDASFEVGGVEMVSGGAYVTSLWTEPGNDGLTRQFDIIWILRQQQDGWRIAGMATRVAANEPPTYLNFEEPEEMIRIWKDADRRLATQQDEGAATAGN